jgi:hypothetical protein
MMSSELLYKWQSAVLTHDSRALQHALQLVYDADSQLSAKPPHSLSVPPDGQSLTHLEILQSTYHLAEPVALAALPVVDLETHVA